LTSADLPAGYSEAVVPLGDRPGEMRLFVRSQPGPGAAAIWSMTMRLEGVGRALPLQGPLGTNLAEQLVDGFVGSLRPAGVELALSDWAALEPPPMLDRVVAYSFRYTSRPLAATTAEPLGAPWPAQGDGAFVLFARGDLLSALMVFNTDGQASQDIWHYAAVVAARL
jgi:hypothetical protein